MKEWMKFALVIGVFILTMSIIKTASAYTYEGPIDPGDLAKLTCPTAGNDNGAKVYACNFDGMDVAKWVYRGYIVQYAYKINDITHVFTLRNGHYEQTYPEKENII